MYKWNPIREANERDAYSKLVHVTAGLYFWEFFTSLDFDWTFLTGKRRLKWPTVVYFLNRYCFLAALISLMYAQDITTTVQIDCRVVYDIVQVTGNMSVGLSSMTFALRTAAIYGLLFCKLANSGSTGYREKVASIYKLETKLISRMAQKSQTVTMLFRDGLIYYIVALLGNVLVAVFELLDIDPIFDVMFNMPSIAIMTIAATRAVRNLQDGLMSNGMTVTSGVELTTELEVVELGNPNTGQ
ncbi:unnamed protein product [Somion occarium]|uniref:Uncharacterized protein n=1 Tax=Somion occarium TaxID=3059160 RepID=A0ABP1DN03_9APHY